MKSKATNDTGKQLQHHDHTTQEVPHSRLISSFGSDITPTREALRAK